MPTLTITSPADMTAVAAMILKHVDASEHAGVVALHGELGAGKTTLVQHLAKVLGISEEVTSPTFVIMKQYDTLTGPTDIDILAHIDAYRVEDAHEMDVLGFDELLGTSRMLIAIEWAENLAPLLPKYTIDVHLEIIDPDGGRRVTIRGY